jgi:hypothetical protein
LRMSISSVPGRSSALIECLLRMLALNDASFIDALSIPTWLLAVGSWLSAVGCWLLSRLRPGSQEPGAEL